MIVRPSNLYDPTPNVYSHAVRVGNMVHVAGQMAVGEGMRVVGGGDIEAQTRQVFANIAKILAATGGGLADIVNMSVFLKDMGDLRGSVTARREVFGRDFPASTAVQAAGFADPAGLVEVSAVAVIGSGTPNKTSKPPHRLRLKSL